MSERTQKTDRDRLGYTPPKGARFLDEYFAGHREDDFVSGLKAFAHEWFREYEDEKNLPIAFFELCKLAEDFTWDVSELTGEDEDED